MSEELKKDAGSNFIKVKIDMDLEQGKYKEVVTRFPPEPNGFLHIGHAKSICLNFGLANEYKAVGKNTRCHLRFDDTNPTKEEDAYVESIRRDVKWLGFDWGEHEYYASDYFDQLYQWAIDLIKAGKAYVCRLTAQEMKEYRGSLTAPGRNSPYRNTSVEENLKLFLDMKEGKFQDGEVVLRAKIDMSHPNINMRDPVLYRVLKAHHHRTGMKWCIYPMYDYAHGQSDAIEGVTHSLCTLEFEDHRPLYNWFLESLNIKHRPEQTEFARLNLEYAVVSKRKLLQLVEEGFVWGWDDPRMPTLSGLRRRGVPAKALHLFCERLGVAKKQSTVDMALLEDAIRDEMNLSTPRLLGVIHPIKITIENIEEGEVIEIKAPFNQQDEKFGSRMLHFSKHLLIEESDFMINAPKDFYRLKPNGFVRLRYGFIIECLEVIQDSNGKVIELKCRYHKETLGGKPLAAGGKVKGIIHWVSEEHSQKVKLRLFDRLFTNPSPGKESGNFLDDINPESLVEVEKAYIEKSFEPRTHTHFQLERLGYFAVDSEEKNLVINKVVGLRDTWK